MLLVQSTIGGTSSLHITVCGSYVTASPSLMRASAEPFIPALLDQQPLIVTRDASTRHLLLPPTLEWPLHAQLQPHSSVTAATTHRHNTLASSSIPLSRPAPAVGRPHVWPHDHAQLQPYSSHTAVSTRRHNPLASASIPLSRPVPTAGRRPGRPATAQGTDGQPTGAQPRLAGQIRTDQQIDHGVSPPPTTLIIAQAAIPPPSSQSTPSPHTST